MAITKKMSQYMVIIGVLLIISLYIIFFTGTSTNPTTGQNIRDYWTLTGASQFRLGMDVSGGVRLTYKVDFSQYEQSYTDQFTADTMKQDALRIIKNNIEQRVGVLAASDSKVLTKKMGNENFIVVELGGVQSLEQAKETIGKTVELDFKLPFDPDGPEAQVYREQREQLTQQVVQDVIANPSQMEEIAETRQTEDVLYVSYDRQSLDDIPSFFQDNQSAWQNLQPGEVADPIQGVFQTTFRVNEQGQPEEQELIGTTLIQYQDQQVRAIESLQVDKVQKELDEQGFQSDVEPIPAPESYVQGTYSYEDGQFVYLGDPTFVGEEAYRASIYAIAKSLDDSEIMGTGDTDGISQVQSLTDQVEQLLDQGDIQAVEQLSGVQLLSDNQWIALSSLQQAIPTLSPNYNPTQAPVRQVADTLDSRYVIVWQDYKPAEAEFVQSIRVEMDDAAFANIEPSLQEEVVVSLNAIFINQEPRRITAKDPVSDQILNGAYFQRALLNTTQGVPQVEIVFDNTGAEIFCNITRENIGNQMAIFVGGDIVTSPVINSEICQGSAVIDGQESAAQARELIAELNEGALPAPLLLANEEKVSPSLGERALRASLIAGALGLLLMFCMLWLMYGHKKAVIGLVVLLTFLIYLMAFFKLFNFAFSLSGIAAIILSLGMGIDANILIFERVREELKSGKRLKRSINTGYKRSLNPIRDGNLSTIMIAIFLVFFGVGMFRGFGTMMLLTILMTLCINVPLTKYLLHAFFSAKKQYMQDT